jgi:hypothetical protein
LLREKKQSSLCSKLVLFFLYVMKGQVYYQLLPLNLYSPIILFELF